MSQPTTPNTENSATSGPQVSVHRWPWRTEEFVSMGVAVLFVVGLGYFVFTSRRETMPAAVALAVLVVTLVASIASVYYLYRVKKKRTDTSQVTVTIIGTVVRSESKGALGNSQADITKTKTVSYRKFGSDETFMIMEDDQAVRIPLRTTADTNVRAAVETAFSTAANVSDEARNLFERMQAGELP